MVLSSDIHGYAPAEFVSDHQQNSSGVLMTSKGTPCTSSASSGSSCHLAHQAPCSRIPHQPNRLTELSPCSQRRLAQKLVSSEVGPLSLAYLDTACLNAECYIRVLRDIVHLPTFGINDVGNFLLPPLAPLGSATCKRDRTTILGWVFYA